MKICKLTMGALALLALAPAGAQLVTLVDAVELSPSNIILPGSLNGTVTFRPCVGECEEEHRRARLTPETQFFVDEQKVKFDAFRDSMSLLRSDEDAYALISVDMQITDSDEHSDQQIAGHRFLALTRRAIGSRIDWIEVRTHEQVRKALRLGNSGCIDFSGGGCARGRR